MLKKLIIFKVVFLLTLNLQANCLKPVTYLDKGKETPCEGFLFSREKEREVRLIAQNYELLKQEVENKDKKINLILKDLALTESIIIKEREKSELWRARAEQSTLALVKESDSRATRDWWMILLGVGLTVGAGWALGQVNK
jgi:hypothetical protein